MQIDEMKNLLREGKNPILVSAIKWMDVAYNNGEDMGNLNCALCYRHKDGPDAMSGNCTNCPVYKKTGNSLCKGTPFDELCKHKRSAHGGHLKIYECPECKRLVVDEMNFLLELMNKTETEDDMERFVMKVEKDKIESNTVVIVLPFGSTPGAIDSAHRAMDELEEEGWVCLFAEVGEKITNVKP